MPRWLPYIPLLPDKKTTGLRSGLTPHKLEDDRTSWRRDLSLPCSSGLTLPSEQAEVRAVHTIANPSILLLLPWWLCENLKQNSSAFTGPTPTPTLIPNEVRWPDVVYLPVTTAAMKLSHTSILKPEERGTSLLSVCGHSRFFMKPPPFNRPKVRQCWANKEHPSMCSVYQISHQFMIHSLALGLQTQNSFPSFLFKCCHCSYCMSLNTHKACTNADTDSNTSPSIKMLFARHKEGHTEMMWCRGWHMMIHNMSSSSYAGNHFHLTIRLTDRLLMKQQPPYQGRMQSRRTGKKQLQSTPTYIASPSSSSSSHLFSSLLCLPSSSTSHFAHTERELPEICLHILLLSGWARSSGGFIIKRAVLLTV